MTKKFNRTLWALQVILTFLFLFAGVMKLVTPIEEMTKDIALPGLFLRFIGIAEVVGAIGLILPSALKIQQGLTPLAAGGLVLIMMGATVVCLMTPNPGTALIPLVVGAFAGFVAYYRSGLAARRLVETQA